MRPLRFYWDGDLPREPRSEKVREQRGETGYWTSQVAGAELKLEVYNTIQEKWFCQAGHDLSFGLLWTTDLPNHDELMEEVYIRAQVFRRFYSQFWDCFFFFTQFPSSSYRTPDSTNTIRGPDKPPRRF